MHGHRHGHGHDRARECGVGVDRERAALKEAAANAVKDALKDLYARRQIDKEMFKSLAQSATHTVCGDVAAGRLSRQALLAGDTVAALTAVRGALAAAGLGHLHP